MSAESLCIGIAGAGRMGLAIADAVHAHADLELGGVWARGNDAGSRFSAVGGAYVGDDLERVVAAADVVIDFSLPQGTSRVIAGVVAARKPLVCGVSGLDDEQMAALDKAAERIPLVYDRNMSQGVAVLTSLARRAAASLSEEFAVEIHETHHVHKKDAPSGTALKLGEAIAAARGRDFDAADIRFEVTRRGEVPGDHVISLVSPTERLTLGHSVTTRAVFADGALRAARWVAGESPGRYDMHDVLFGDAKS